MTVRRIVSIQIPKGYGGISLCAEKQVAEIILSRRGRNFKVRLRLKKVQCSNLFFKSSSGFPPKGDAGFRILRETIFPTKQHSLNDT